MMAYPTHNPPWRVGDKLHIYYTGVCATPEQVGRKDLDMAIGLMTIGLNRFAGLANRRGHRLGAGGSLLTKPFVVNHDLLEVNAEPLMRGRLKVAIMTPDENVFPGYGHEDCTLDVMDPDAIHHRIGWTVHKDLSQLRGKTVRLHFQVKSTALYGYRLLNVS